MVRHAERGSSMVETAVALAATLAFLLGIMDMGRALFTYEHIANVTRIGARWAIVHGSDCKVAGCPASATDVQTYVQSVANGLPDPANLTVDPAIWPGSSTCTKSPYKSHGCPVVVTVSYTFHFLMPYMPATIPLVSTSKMIISQ